MLIVKLPKCLPSTHIKLLLLLQSYIFYSIFLSEYRTFYVCARCIITETMVVLQTRQNGHSLTHLRRDLPGPSLQGFVFRNSRQKLPGKQRDYHRKH